VTARGGTTTTPLTYGGGYADSATGLIYLVNRYHDPASGSFTTVDPAFLTTGAAYTYANGDPANAWDPMGLDWWNPTSWSGRTWALVGTGVALVAVGVATAGIGDAVIGGVAVTSEVTLETTTIVGTEEALTVTTESLTVAETTEYALTVDAAVKGTAAAVAVGSTARGGVGTYRACRDVGVISRACIQNAAGTVAGAADPLLGLGAWADAAYNLGLTANAFLTPEGEPAGEAPRC